MEGTNSKATVNLSTANKANMDKAAEAAVMEVGTETNTILVMLPLTKLEDMAGLVMLMAEVLLVMEEAIKITDLADTAAVAAGTTANKVMTTAAVDTLPRADTVSHTLFYHMHKANLTLFWVLVVITIAILIKMIALIT